jgi:hypothetical protein
VPRIGWERRSLSWKGEAQHASVSPAALSPSVPVPCFGGGLWRVVLVACLVASSIRVNRADGCLWNCVGGCPRLVRCGALLVPLRFRPSLVLWQPRPLLPHLGGVGSWQPMHRLCPPDGHSAAVPTIRELVTPLAPSSVSIMGTCLMVPACAASVWSGT